MALELKIGLWGARQQNFVLSLDDTRQFLRLEKTSYKKEEKDGVLKEFLFGKSLILFSLNREHFIVVNKRSYPLNSAALQLICRNNFLYNTLEIVVDGRKLCRFHDVSLFMRLDKVDPLYDDVDKETDDFIHYLKALKVNRR
jgi:hypothetical protein